MSTKNLRTLSLPDDLKNAHLEQNLPYSSAVELSKIKDASDRQALLSEALKDTLSFRKIKDRVREKIEKTEKTEKFNKTEDKALIKRFEEMARRAKKSAHVINESKKKRRIEKLLEQLEGLLLEEKRLSLNETYSSCSLISEEALIIVARVNSLELLSNSLRRSLRQHRPKPKLILKTALQCRNSLP